ncbi:hypothetical protein DY000_02041306 [Brassica cretica]|uniref:F-box domain-containing protein n=1 Tax=Brassica cretica TaxID=69181 RepID=A0ABQ7BKW5_BRACR|nr:hypothetical protein DY000_02041306 [Brassica cretica]
MMTKLNSDVEEQASFSLLPDDIILSCLALMSKSYYPKLSLVSKRFHALIVSNGLSPFGSDQVLTNDMEEYSYNKSTGNTLLVGIPSSSYVPKLKIGMVGSKHYAVRHYNIPPTSSPILIREEGTHTWRKAPSMKVARENPMVDILDGKIYVMGGCNADESTNWVDILRCLHVRG